MSALRCPTVPKGSAFRRAVVFGACGFLGRVVVRQLLDSGAQVLGIDTRPWPGALPAGYAHSGRAAAALGEAAEFLKQGPTACSSGPSSYEGSQPRPLPNHAPPIAGPGGAAPLAGVQGAAPPELPTLPGPAAFFHLAGLADAGACQRDPALAQKLNVDLVAEALGALVGVSCAFVFPSTGIVYGDALPGPAREHDPLLPTAEYARGKIAAEALIREACASGPLRGAIARLSNLYGPGGGENTVLGRILAQARRGEPLQVWDESPVRDFLYVEDAAQGLLRLGLAACALPPHGPQDDAAWGLLANLSTGAGASVGQLIDLCAELFHTSRLPQEREPAAGARASSLVLDNSRLAALTGWLPETQLAQGLKHCFQNVDS